MCVYRRFDISQELVTTEAKLASKNPITSIQVFQIVVIQDSFGTTETLLLRTIDYYENTVSSNQDSDDLRNLVILKHCDIF